VLVTGPTGSGKSTTLAAMIDHINETTHGHILTLEDPIEFVHTSKKCLVNQREVGTQTHSFNAALKSALREDPDVILVGELRDLETVSLALTAAETGHLVFGTVHTSSAPKTVDRLIDVFPTQQQAQIRTMLSESLLGVATQALLPKIGGGRAAAIEILVATPAVRNLIREAKTHQIPSAMQVGARVGMVTMEAALAELVQRGVVSPDEVKSRIPDMAEQRAIQGGAR
jgi:twitching motility protein PilT